MRYVRRYNRVLYDPGNISWVSVLPKGTRRLATPGLANLPKYTLLISPLVLHLVFILEYKKLSSLKIDMYLEGLKMAVLAYVLVTLQSGSEKNVLKKVASFEEVEEVDLVYGEYDAMVKVLVEEMSQLDKFLTDKLRVLPDIYLTTTMIVARQYKGT